MSPTKKHEVRRIRGKRKGQFCRLKDVVARENLLFSIQKAREKSENVPDRLVDPDKQTWGRRIIDLEAFETEMWCKVCNIPLSLMHRTNERRIGLASVFTVKCMQCSTNRFVHSDIRDPIDGSYPVNSALALSIIDNGIGGSHANNFVSSLGIPPVPSTTLKRYERKVGPVIETVAEESCLESIRIEKELTKNEIQKQLKEKTVSDSSTECNEMNANMTEENNNLSESSKVYIKCGYDAGWQKRGTGHAYNSLSGHGTAIGFHSGKVLSYAVRSKDCRLCKLGHCKTDHDCRQNYNSSAKSMESDMAVQLITNNPLFDKENVGVNVLIGDDDSSTIAAVRRESNEVIEKWSDFNHTHKNFTSTLYEMKLSKTLRDYFSKNFSIAVKQNQGNAENVEQALLAVVPHAYNEHTLCGDWCEAISLGEDYRHRNLPNGQSLTDPVLRVALTQLFAKFAANASKINQCASTQANESINNTIASKNPKSRHYGASESLNFRVAAGIAQKNYGSQYGVRVLTKMGCNPSAQTIKHRQSIDHIRKLKAQRNQQIDKKRRRNELKALRSSQTAASKRKEGITYETGIALNDVSDLIKSKKSSAVVQNIDSTECKVIIYDLETTGLSMSDEIVQIAALYNEDTVFSAYIIPSKPVSKGASIATGLAVIDGDLCLHGEKVNAIPAKTAMLQFIKYLTEFGCDIVLLAHNGFTFDMPRLLRLISNVGLMEKFSNVVKGFSDSLHILRKALPERKKNKEKFSIIALVTSFLPEIDVTLLHNAIDDVKTLKKLLDKIAIPNNVFIEESKSIAMICDEEKTKNIVLLNKASLVDYKENISSSMINKMARCGITKQVLQLAFERSGIDGLRCLLGENVNDKPRVTKNKKVLEKICNIFAPKEI